MNSHKITVRILAIIFLIIAVPIFSISNTMVSQGATIKFIVKASSVEYTIDPGEKISLYVDTKKTVKWKSSNKKVATITKNGLVTGKKEGSATITAEFSSKKYKCKVIVYDEEQAIQNARDAVEDEFSNSYDAATLPADIKFVTPTSAPSSDFDDEEEDKEYDIVVPEEESKSLKEQRLLFSSWISQRDLSDKYRISVSWSDGKMELVNTNNFERFVMPDVPNDLSSEEIYTSNGIRFRYISSYNSIFFNISDLKNQKII